MKIVNVDIIKIYPDDVERLGNLGDFISYDNIPTEKEGIQRIKDADIVIDNWFDMPANVIASCPNLKMISVGAK